MKVFLIFHTNFTNSHNLWLWRTIHMWSHVGNLQEVPCQRNCEGRQHPQPVARRPILLNPPRRRSWILPAGCASSELVCSENCSPWLSPQARRRQRRWWRLVWSQSENTLRCRCFRMRLLMQNGYCRTCLCTCSLSCWAGVPMPKANLCPL